jgi:hypothetical protein
MLGVSIRLTPAAIAAESPVDPTAPSARVAATRELEHAVQKGH